MAVLVWHATRGDATMTPRRCDPLYASWGAGAVEQSVGADEAAHHGASPLNRVFDGRRGAGRVTGSLKHQAAAMWHMIRGRHDNALAQHHATLEDDPTHWSALFFVVERLRREGRDAEALAAAQRALESQPAHFLALQTAACLSVKLGRHNDAKDYVERGLKALPDVRPGSRSVLDVFFLLVWRVARLVRGRRAPGTPPEALASATARYLDDWKEWALAYLAWRKATNAAEHTSARG